MAKHSSAEAKTNKKTKKKGNKKGGPDAISMKLKAQKPNPFETIWSHRKFDILGKKCKGEERRVGLACSLAIQKIAKQSRKFCPEAIMFFRTLLMAATDQKLASEQDSQLKALRPLLRVHGRVDEINPLNFLIVMELPDDDSFFSSDNFRASALVTVIETLRGFVEIYDGLDSFTEIFLPIATLLLEVSQQKHMLEALKDKFNDVPQLIKKKTAETHMLRRPLQLLKQKPVPFKLLNPKFENFVKGRDYDPDRERATRRKLQKLIKCEELVSCIRKIISYTR